MDQTEVGPRTKTPDHRQTSRPREFRPEMLVLAREWRGFTQSGLANATGVSQGKISKIENGLLGPEEDLIGTLAEACAVPEGFFGQRGRVYGPPISFFRKRMTLPKKALAQTIAELEVRRLHLVRLLQSLDVQFDYQVPEYDVDAFDGDAAEIARAVRSSWQLPKGPVKHLTSVLESGGAIVVPCALHGKIDAVSQRIPEAPPLLFMNSSKPMDRLRFSMAHELGHIVMHGRGPTPGMESEADSFAAEFLMPAAEMARELPKGRLRLEDLAYLKRVWRVSMAALLYRAKTLGRVTERQYRYLFMQMGKLGYRSQEPVELEPPVERAELLPGLLRAYRKELGYLEEELAEMLSLKVEDLRAMYPREETNGHLRVIK